MVYGEGDFKRSMILAINCGDDTDCTGATVGSTLGIIGGMSGIPEDWRAHIGDSIVTVSLSAGSSIRPRIPATCTELAARVERITPHVLFAKGADVSLGEGEELPADIADKMKALVRARVLPLVEALRPYAMHFDSPTVSADVTLDRAPDIAPLGEIGAEIVFRLNESLDNQPRALTLRWLLPEGFSVEGKQSLMLHHINAHCPTGSDTLHIRIKAPEAVAAKNIILLEVMDEAHFTPLYIRFPLFG